MNFGIQLEYNIRMNKKSKGEEIALRGKSTCIYFD